MNKKILILFLVNLIVHTLLGQVNTTISGYVYDKQNGEILIGASIYNAELKRGVLTNEYGFYSITLQKKIV